MTGIRFAFSDVLVIAERSLRRVQRQPDLLTAFTIQPVMFIVLFVYVFGGAISVPAEFGDYTDFLMPGIMVQSIAFGGFVTALGLAEDLNKGLIDRFRSLPMARSAVLTGRTFADIATNALSLVVMITVGSDRRLQLQLIAVRDHRRDRADAPDRLHVLAGSSPGSG